VSAGHNRQRTLRLGFFKSKEIRITEEEGRTGDAIFWGGD